MKKSIKILSILTLTSLLSVNLIANDFVDDLKEKSKTRVKDKWALVNEECNPALDIQKAYGDMSNQYKDVLSMLQKQFTGSLEDMTDSLGNSIGNVFEQELLSDELAMIMTQQKCVQNLTSGIGSMGPVQDRISGVLQKCTAEFTQGALNMDTKNTMGSSITTNTGFDFDISKMANIGTCSMTAYKEVFGDLFDDCYISEKQNSKNYLEDMLANIIKQSQKDLELQHEKCKIDKQNYETKYNGVQGSGYKTTKNRDGSGVTILDTNSAFNSPMVLEDSKLSARQTCDNYVNKIKMFSNDREANSSLSAEAYSDVLNNWCNTLFPVQSSCSYTEIKTDSKDLRVPTCRWQTKISHRTADEMSLEVTGSQFHLALNKIPVIDECLSVIRTKEPLKDKYSKIVSYENSKPNAQLNENYVSFPSGESTRFNYFLQRDKLTNQKYQDPKYRSQNNKLIVNDGVFEKYTNYAMQQVCMNWYETYELESSSLKAKQTNIMNKANLTTNSNKRLSQADKDAKSILDESRKAEEKYWNNVTSKFNSKTNQNIIKSDSKDIKSIEYKIYN